MRFAVALALIAVVGACTGDGDPPLDLDADIEIGGADQSGAGFVALLDGDLVELATGGQGGFHVWTALRIKGAMGELYLDREARRVSDGTLVLRADDQFIAVPELAMESWWQREEAMPSFMCPAPVGVTIFEEELEFTARLLTKDGQLLAQDSIVLQPVCPSGDQQATCRRICDG